MHLVQFYIPVFVNYSTNGNTIQNLVLTIVFHYMFSGRVCNCPSSPISWQVCMKSLKNMLIACSTYKIGKWIVNPYCHFYLTKMEITWNFIFSDLFPYLSVPVGMVNTCYELIFMGLLALGVKVGEMILNKRRCNSNK